MRDTQLYQQTLGPSEPWHVERIDLKMTEQEVHVYVEHKPGVAWPCPTCGRELTCFAHAPERVWRHLDTCQLKTLLHARPRGCRGSIVPSMACCRPRSTGPSRAAGSRC